MTGTPEPFKAHVNLDFPKELTNELYLLDKCENVVPKNVILIDEISSKKKILELLENGEKVIYFTNHTLTESEVVKNFNIPDSVKVGVSFSKEDKKKNLEQVEKEKIDNIENSLATHSLIPADIQFFVTTSRNKEGINIHNKDYANMFVETHLMYDIVQMAGRVREGVENLYIISNAEQFGDNGDMTDILFSKKVLVANTDYANSEDKANQYLINEYLENDVQKEKTEEDRKRNIRNYVRYIENRFSYVRYNIFAERFEFFKVKERAEIMAGLQQNLFNEMLSSHDNTFVENWFPNSHVTRELSPQEKGGIYLKSLFEGKQYVILSKEELRNHLSKIRELFNSNLKSPNPILHMVDDNFHCKETGKNYIIYYGKEDPRVKKISMRKWGKK